MTCKYKECKIVYSLNTMTPGVYIDMGYPHAQMRMDLQRRIWFSMPDHSVNERTIDDSWDRDARVWVRK